MLVDRAEVAAASAEVTVAIQRAATIAASPSFTEVNMAKSPVTR
jgi:hypothetical protein